MKKPTNIINTSPEANESWGSYNSQTKQWSAKVYSGKAVREWIQNAISNILELLGHKVSDETYANDIETINGTLNAKADKNEVAASATIVYPENFVVQTDENSSTATESLKNVKYVVRDSRGNPLFNFWAIVQKYIEYVPPVYPKVWFISSTEPLLSSDISNRVLSTAPEETGYTYQKSLTTTNYYVVLQTGHSLRKVTNSTNFEFTNQFKTDDVQITGYVVYHYQREVDSPVTWTFNVN